MAGIITYTDRMLDYLRALFPDVTFGYVGKPPYDTDVAKPEMGSAAMRG